MDYNKYAAHFVMLEEQNNVFAFRATLPVKGHIKIETGNRKGAMRVIVQNMRFYERGPYVYKLILFGKKREKTIHAVMGTVSVNRYGNGETYLRFDPLDTDGKGRPLSAFSVAIVVAVSTKSDKEALHPVLKGEILLGEDGEEVGAEDSPEEEELLETVLEDSPEKGSRKTYNGYYNKYLVDACRRTMKMEKYYDDVMPFQGQRFPCRWKKIVNVASLPVVSPGALYFATKYRHYLFGIGEEHCFFAVPGRLMNEEQPDRGESGFVLWEPLLGAESEPGSYGYWIAAINLESGDIEEV